ncbi:hypothetical protein ACIBKY_17090 [Nonomuraea sp. NPDC050394]|uniref:hypothetical protein n=1 Tax=Nonomuraea sp. NPDC050394 TaxID=3364363 RepID=UPI0037A3EC8D
MADDQRREDDKVRQRMTVTILAVLGLAFPGLAGADTWHAIACAVKPPAGRPAVIVADREEVLRFWAGANSGEPVASHGIIVKRFPGEPDVPAPIGLERKGPPGCPDEDD